jgi:dihydrofolate synthase/folylpolyglutamate synthase
MDFFAEQKGEAWQWRNSQRRVDNLPLPALHGDFQLRNAAGVLSVLAVLEGKFPVNEKAIARGLQTTSLPGRFQILPGAPLRIFDVAHNEQSAQALAKNLSAAEHGGQTHVILAMLADKDIPAVVSQLLPLVNHWYLAPLPVPRAATVAQLQSALADVSILVDTIKTFNDVNDAFQAALAASTAQDRIVVTGSFYTVAAVLGEAV